MRKISLTVDGTPVTGTRGPSAIMTLRMSIPSASTPTLPQRPKEVRVELSFDHSVFGPVAGLVARTTPSLVVLGITEDNPDAPPFNMTYTMQSARFVNFVASGIVGSQDFGTVVVKGNLLEARLVQPVPAASASLL